MHFPRAIFSQLMALESKNALKYCQFWTAQKHVKTQMLPKTSKSKNPIINKHRVKFRWQSIFSLLNNELVILTRVTLSHSAVRLRSNNTFHDCYPNSLSLSLSLWSFCSISQSLSISPFGKVRRIKATKLVQLCGYIRLCDYLLTRFEVEGISRITLLQDLP